MKSKIDSVVAKAIYAKRIATAEPPFAHIRSVMGLARFSFRGKSKVNNQWLLFCIVHNLKKVHKYGMAVTVWQVYDGKVWNRVTIGSIGGTIAINAAETI